MLRRDRYIYVGNLVSCSNSSKSIRTFIIISKVAQFSFYRDCVTETASSQTHTSRFTLIFIDLNRVIISFYLTLEYTEKGTVRIPYLILYALAA